MEDKQVNSLSQVGLSGLRLPIVAVYRHPEDYPGQYVARVYDLEKATNTVMVKDSREEIELDIRNNCSRMMFIPRSSRDVPALVGSWV